MTLSIRTLDRKRDRTGVEAIDTSFQTDSVYDVVTNPRGFELVTRRLEAPLTKRFPIDEVFAPWAKWTRGWVAEDTEIRGVATLGYEEWHHRLVLWFLYVAPAWRRHGIGRRLLAEVETYGREVGASHVWLETSNINVPAIAAYERLGYTVAGVDLLFYESYMPGETAVYLAKKL